MDLSLVGGLSAGSTQTNREQTGERGRGMMTELFWKCLASVSHDDSELGGGGIRWGAL